MSRIRSIHPGLWTVKVVLGTVRRELREAEPDAPEAPEPEPEPQPRQLFRRPIYEVGDDGAESHRRKYGDPDDMVPLDSISRPVRDRIVNRFRQKPNWTATLLAKDLGVRIEVVRTVLAHHQQVAA